WVSVIWNIRNPAVSSAPAVPAPAAGVVPPFAAAPAQAVTAPTHSAPPVRRNKSRRLVSLIVASCAVNERRVERFPRAVAEDFPCSTSAHPLGYAAQFPLRSGGASCGRAKINYISFPPGVAAWPPPGPEHDASTHACVT